MSALMTMPWDEARRVKFERGRDLHRSGAPAAEFVGDPFVEALEECLDLDNYFEEIERQGTRIPPSMRAVPRMMAEWLKRNASQSQ